MKQYFFLPSSIYHFPFSISHYLILSIITFFAILQSCIKEKYDFNKLAEINWEPGVAMPLIHSVLTTRDLLRNYDTLEIIVEDQTGFLTLVYRDTLFSISASQLVYLPNQTANKTITLTQQQIDNFPDILEVNFTENYNFLAPSDVNGDTIKLKTIIFKSGNLNISLNSTFQQSGTITVTLPYATLDGNPYIKIIPFDYNGTFPIIINNDLTGYTLDLSEGGITYNSFSVIYDVTLFKSGNPVSGSESLSLDINLNDPQFYYLGGYLGQHSIALTNDTLALKLRIYDKNISGSIYYEDPRINIYITNSYGIPIQAVFPVFQASSNKNGITIDIEAPGFIPGPLIFDYPLIPGLSSSTNLVLNSVNSNIKEIIEISPNKLIYEVIGTLNPNGDVGNINFITDSSIFRLEVEVELPLYGNISNFVLQDTVPFESDINSDTLMQPGFEIEYAVFEVNIDNGFPIDLNMQIYFVDEYYNILDSLIYDNQKKIVLSGLIGPAPDYRVHTSTLSTTSITVNKTRLNKIEQSKKMIIRAALETTNSGNSLVKLFIEYEIDIKIGVLAKLKGK